MKYSTNQFKQGMKLLIEGEPCSVLSYEFHKPGKGQAVMRTKLYNLRTQKVWERTFKSGESVESADVIEKDFQFLYNEGGNYVFMDQSTYEQVEVNSEQLGEIKHWLDGEEECKILFWDGAVLNIEPPTFVEKKVRFRRADKFPLDACVNRGRQIPPRRQPPFGHPINRGCWIPPRKRFFFEPTKMLAG